MVAAMDCTRDHEDYVSFSVSQDSEEDDIVSHFFEGTKSLFEDPEALFLESDCFAIDFPKPVSKSTAQNLSEALMGDYIDDHVYSSDTDLIGIPDPQLFHDRVKSLRTNTELTIAGFTIYPFLSLLMKSEMFPLGTAVEAVCSLAIIIVWIQVVLLATSGWSITVVGGIAFFVGSTMLHFWYGFNRYHSFPSGFKNFLQARALDETFEHTRDICSRQCHGDWQRRRSAFITVWTLPSTLPYHLLGTFFHGIHGIFRWMLRKGPPESPRFALKCGTYTANALLALSWSSGSPLVITYAVFSFLVNQRLYDALLFRRNWNGFLSTLVLGDLLVFGARERGEQDSAASPPIEMHEIKRKSSINKGKEDSTLGATNAHRTLASRLKALLTRPSSDNGCGKGSTPPQSTEQDHDSSTFSNQETIICVPGLEPVHCDAKALWKEMDQGIREACLTFGGTGVPNASRPEVKDDDTIPLATTPTIQYVRDQVPDHSNIINHDAPASSGETNEQPRSSSFRLGGSENATPPTLEEPIALNSTNTPPELFKPNALITLDDAEDAVRENKSKQIISKPSLSERMLKILPLAKPTDPASEERTMDANDVYIQVETERLMQVESHPGTMAFTEAIQEASRKFQKSPFGDEHFRHIMKVMEGVDRDFYAGGPEFGWTKLNPIQIRAKCQEAYNKQIETEGEISTIFTEIVQSQPRIERGEISLIATAHNRPSIEVQLSKAKTAEQRAPRKKSLAALTRLIDATSTKDTITSSPEPPTTSHGKKQSKLLVYLGKKDNHGYKRFLKALHSVIDSEPSEQEYTVTMHSAVLAETNAKQYFVKKASDTFQKATEGDVLDFAWQHYSTMKQPALSIVGSTNNSSQELSKKQIEQPKSPQRLESLKKILTLRALSGSEYHFDKTRSEQSIEVVDIIKRRHLPKRSTKKEWRQMYPDRAMGLEPTTKDEETDIGDKEVMSPDMTGHGSVDLFDEFLMTIVASTSADNDFHARKQQFCDGRPGVTPEEKDLKGMDELLAEGASGENTEAFADESICLSADSEEPRWKINGLVFKRLLPRGYTKGAAQGCAIRETIGAEDEMEQMDGRLPEEGTEVTEVIKRRHLPRRSTKKEWRQMYPDREAGLPQTTKGVVQGSDDEEDVSIDTTGHGSVDLFDEFLMTIVASTSADNDVRARTQKTRDSKRDITPDDIMENDFRKHKECVGLSGDTPSAKKRRVINGGGIIRLRAGGYSENGAVQSKRINDMMQKNMEAPEEREEDGIRKVNARDDHEMKSMYALLEEEGTEVTEVSKRRRFKLRGLAKSHAIPNVATQLKDEKLPTDSETPEEPVDKDGREPEEVTSRACQALKDLPVEVCAEEPDDSSVEQSICHSRDITTSDTFEEPVSSLSKRSSTGLGFTIKRFVARGLAKDSAVRKGEIQTPEDFVDHDDGREPEEAHNRALSAVSGMLVAEDIREANDAPVDESIALSPDTIPVVLHQESYEEMGQEVVHDLVPSPSKRIMGLGFKQFLSRVRSKHPGQSFDIVPLEDEESRRDPTKVHQWISINRNKSKYLSDIWAKASLNRRAKQIENTKQDDNTHVDDSNEADGYYVEVGQSIQSESLYDDEYDMELGSFKQEFKGRPGLNYEESFFEELKAVLALECGRATGLRSHGDSNLASAIWDDDISCDYGDVSTIDTYSTTDDTVTIPDDVTDISPQTLLELVERRIEDEILNSMDICEDIQKIIKKDYGVKTPPRRLVPHQNEFVF